MVRSKSEVFFSPEQISELVGDSRTAIDPIGFLCSKLPRKKAEALRRLVSLRVHEDDALYVNGPSVVGDLGYFAKDVIRTSQPATDDVKASPAKPGLQEWKQIGLTIQEIEDILDNDRILRRDDKTEQKEAQNAQVHSTLRLDKHTRTILNGLLKELKQKET